MTMSEVSRIKFGLPHTNTLNGGVKPEKKEAEAANTKGQAQEASVDPGKMMNALDVAGQYNATNLGISQVDPRRYLSPERINEIEASMVKFEGGTQAHLAAFENEFGHLGEYSALNDSEKLEMAAKSFALEN